MIRTYQFRVTPTPSQEREFERILDDSCETYNAALQERRDAWKLQRKQVSMYDQFAQIAKLRKDVEFSGIASEIQREPVRRLDRAFRNFFIARKDGRNVGFPRFRSRSRYNSFSWQKASIGHSSFLVPLIGRVRWRGHRKTQGAILNIDLKKKGRKWVAFVTCDIGPAPEKCAVSGVVGIDVGVTTLATLSDGTTIENQRWTRKHEARIAAANRNLARKQRRSKNRLRAREVLRRAHQRAVDARKNYLHHVSKWLVGRYDLIAHENLKINNMVKGNLAKSIMDAAWGELIRQITYKAESAGKWVIPVNPRGTSIRCSGCGEPVPKTLKDRQHVCGCGVSLDRDHNAALNVLALGRSAVALAKGSITAATPEQIRF